MIDFIGSPQVAALIVLVQRGLEEIHSARNTRRLMAEGAREAGRDYYPVVAVTHLAWIASIFFLIPPGAPVVWPFAILYILLQPLRYWAIATLGRYWTHRIITLDAAPVVARGPYRFIRHPNYAVTIAETFVLPLAFGAVALAVIMTAIWSAVVGYKIVLEDRAIAKRRLETAAERA
ncbi:MAG TPA: isoprenylcysteine carboxylmethyltransferase family protein [Bauldia sp.]|nr:isoprenylcysteine carboxylmethyltransferase family protein [Bauldia sp.]